MDWLKTSSNLIHQACTSWGIKASLTDQDNYNAIFTRDAVMAGIAGILLQDNKIILGLQRTINNLRTLQGAQGQIPSNFTIKDGSIDKVSFGTLSPKIDSCTWYLVGVALLIKEGILQRENYIASVTMTISLLDGIEYNGKHLMYIPKGGNWADEYVFEGYILYDQVLRAWALSLLAQIYEKDLWRIKSIAIKSKLTEKYVVVGSKYFQASIYPGGTFSKFDLAAHSLAGLIFADEDEFFKGSLSWIHQKFSLQGKLPPAFFPIIGEDDMEWDALSKFHLFGFKNKPHHYHNGGIWWIWLGWLSITLSLHNRNKELETLINNSFKLLDSFPDFDFDEYISSDKLTLNGTKRLCYSATGIIMLKLAEQKIDFTKLKP